MKLIIDCDTGVDDAQAIMMAVSKPDVEVLAIMCCHGNATVDQAVHNTLRVLKTWNRLDVPVYRGAAEALLEFEYQKFTPAHGEDGLGDVPDQGPEVDDGLVQKEHAVLALTRLVRAHPGEVTLVSLGPLTNVALAIKMDPSFGNNLKNAVMMGGNIEGVGNTVMSLCGEFNFVADVEAAHIVLKSLWCPITLMSWETTRANKLPWETFQKVLEVETERGKFHRAVTGRWLQKNHELLKLGGYVTCDPLAMMIAIDKNAILESTTKYCAVELKGDFTRGMLCVDWMDYLKREPNINIVTKVDMNIFFHMCMQMVS